MNYPLLTNAAVSLLMGVALILVWRSDRSQAFTRYLGWANLLQLLVPAAYWLTTQHNTSAILLGSAALPFVAASYTSLLMGGAAHLAGRTWSRRALWSSWLALCVLNLAALALGGLRLGQATVATVNTLLGVVCTYWLWSAGTARSRPEKLVGPLLVALGLIQFIFVALLDDGAQLLASIGTVLRMALGMVLLYAALVRTTREGHRLQTRFKHLSERSHQGIVIRQGDQIVYANPACHHMYGVARTQDLSVALFARSLPQADRPAVALAFERVLNGQQDDATYELPCRHPNGTAMWLNFHLFRTEWDGAPATQVLISDDTLRHQATQALMAQALRDELTGLPNRAALIQQLRQRCDGPQPTQPFVLLLLDIDRFQLFNEAHGPSLGDEVLKALGTALRNTLDTSHEVMRLGEDEFAVVSAPDGDGSTALTLAGQLSQVLNRPLAVSSGEFFLAASIGIALYPHSGHDAESLLRAANAAMHVAKRTPGTSYKLAKKEFERGSSNALAQEQAMRSGLENHEFHLVYQPKVDAHSGALTSFEALARWSRPHEREIAPSEFIAVAERTGLMAPLGTLLLRLACQQIAAWHTEFGQCLPVAVNVSPLQLLDPRFPHLVEQTLQEFGVPAHCLTLEITESSAVQSLEQTITQLAQLRTLGVHVALDDFGTGFSSLNMLRTLDLHTIKIDRGLIDPLPQAESVAVVRAICQLAQALHLHVVAEGVETVAQAHAARDAGCGELQGYLYAQPLSPQEAAGWLARAIQATATS